MRSQVVTILLLNIPVFCDVTMCRWVSSSRRNHGGARRNRTNNDIAILRNFGNYILKDSATFQNKLLQHNSHPMSLLSQSETQLWAIHYCLLSRAAQLRNVVQRHFITSTSRLLRQGSISRTVSKTPSKIFYFQTTNRPMAQRISTVGVLIRSSSFFYNNFQIFHVSTGWIVQASDTGRDKKLSLLQKQSKPALGPTQPSIRWVPVFIPGGYSGQGMKLAIHLQLVSRGEELVQLYLIRPQSVDRDKFTSIYFQVLPFIVITNKCEDYSPMKPTALQSRAIYVGR